MSTDQEILIVHAGLDKCAADASECATYMNGKFTQLKQDISKLRAKWDGPAAQRYQKLQDEWDEAADGMRKMLASISQLVVDINKFYGKGETSREQSWNPGGR